MALYGDYSGMGQPSASAIQKMIQADKDAATAKTATSTKTSTRTSSSSGSSSSSTPDYNPENDPAKYYRDPVSGTLYASADAAKQNGVTITPQSLTPKTPLPYEPTNPSAIPNVNDIYMTPPMELTATEREAQTYSDTLRKLNESLIGKSAYQTEQEGKFGIPDLSATLNDLTSQLTTLKNEAASIPLQLQQGAAERGVTTVQLGRQENSRLRTNAIAALGVSSLMAAAQGQLATAQALADRAVAAKYEPIQERINALTANLNIILNSPQFSLEQKNRAQKQLDIQTERQARLEEEKERTKQIQTIAIEAAKNGADSVTLTKIQGAKTAVEAQSMATIFQKTADNIQMALEQGIGTPLVNKQGEWFSPTKKKTYSSPEELFADFPQLQGDFNNAYKLGLVTDMTADRIADREFAAQARAHYWDAGIELNDSPDEIREKIYGSEIYAKETASSGDTDDFNSISGNAEVDARVKQIIKANPGEYGNAAAAIDAEFGEGTASMYDEWLRRVYNYGQNIDDVTSGKAPTEGQRVSAGYAGRMETSNGDINNLASKITGMNLFEWEAQQRLPDSAKSDTFRQYEQAVKNFITAKLRKESGAAIAESEFADAYKVYIPRPGDSAAVLEQKAKARQQVIQQEIANSGTAFNIPASTNTTQNSNTVQMKGPDGALWEVPKENIQLFQQNGYQQISFNKAGNASASNSIIRAVQQKYPQGATGGQCITFLHKLIDFPSVGDGKNEKIASVNKFGIPKSRWTPRVGDVVITGENKTYGHGFMINRLLPGNRAVVTESNYKLNGKVTHTRIVNLNNPLIYGAIRGTPKRNIQLA